MPRDIPIDLTKTGGRLIPPGGLPQPPRRPTDAQPPVDRRLSDPPAQPPPAGEKPDHAHAAGRPCKYCGWPAEKDPVEPTPAEVVEFVRCVVAGVPYATDVAMFDGAGSVRYRDLSTVEEDHVRRAVLAEVARGDMATFYEIQDRFTDLRIGLAVARLTIGPRHHQPEEPPDPLSVDLQARFAAFRDFCKSQSAYQAVRNYYVARFLPVMGAMQAKAFAGSFPPATASPGPSASPASPAA